METKPVRNEREEILKCKDRVKIGGGVWSNPLLNKTCYLVSTVLLLGALQVVLVVKNPPANGGEVRDAGSMPLLGRSPGVRNDNPFHYSCLKNPMDRGAREALVIGLQKNQTPLKRFSTFPLPTSNPPLSRSRIKKKVWRNRSNVGASVNFSKVGGN